MTESGTRIGWIFVLGKHRSKKDLNMKIYEVTVKLDKPKKNVKIIHLNKNDYEQIFGWDVDHKFHDVKIIEGDFSL